MARIKVISECPFYDGMSVTFKAPCDCTAASGLKVYYDTTSQTFDFVDAHGKNLAGLGNLFAKDAYVKVILNTGESKAYIQNADTNAYLERRLAEADTGGGEGAPIVGAASNDGVTYTATVPGVDELYSGLKIIVIPNKTSTDRRATLNVNGLGAKRVFYQSNTTGTKLSATRDDFLTANAPAEMMYFGNDDCWVINITRPAVNELYGEVPVENGGTGRAALTSGSYLVGNGTAAVQLKTKAQVLSDIGAASKTELAKKLDKTGGIIADDDYETTIAPHGVDVTDDYRSVSVRTDGIEIEKESETGKDTASLSLNKLEFSSEREDEDGDIVNKAVGVVRGLANTTDETAAVPYGQMMAIIGGLLARIEALESGGVTVNTTAALDEATLDNMVLE